MSIDTPQPATLEEDVSAHIELVRALSKQTPDPPYHPPPQESLLNSVHTWLRANGHDMSTLQSGEALLLAASKSPVRTLSRRLKNFAEAVETLQLPAEIVPHAADIRFARCWPRVLLAVAHAINKTDPDGWSQAGGDELPDKWEDVALDEAWEGDSLAREIIAVTGGCTIIVAGSQGSGKSATIASLLGRRIIPQSYALMYWPDVELLSEERRRLVYNYEQVVAACWPISPIEMDLPVGSGCVDRAYAKLDGKVLQFIELPSMEVEVFCVDSTGTTVGRENGVFEDVLTELQRNRADVVLVVERMDDLDTSQLRSTARKVQRLYGRAVWQKAILILTHGRSLPPSDMEYAVWKHDCIRMAREAVKKVAGRDLPALVVENVGDMPDGSAFGEQFMGILRTVAKGEGIRPVPVKAWWEDLLMVGALALALPRLL